MGAGLEKAAQWAKEQKEQHKSKGQLLWSGESKAPITCTACGLIWCCAAIHRTGVDRLPKCTGNKKDSDQCKKELKEHAKEIAKAGMGHEWEWPVDGILACKKCGIYLTEKSRNRDSIPFKPCGRVTTNEWKAMVYHSDPKWYRPDVPAKL